MTTGTCAWVDIFDDESRTTLESGLILSGAVCVILGIWLNAALIFTDLRFDLSYRNLATFTFVAWFRRTVAVLSYFPIFNIIEIAGPNSCYFLGFWETFFGVLEVECLTHVCIERYVVAKYRKKGWAIIKNHYILYPCLCVLFALLYSSPPLFGLGKYEVDFSCQSCTMDMVLPATWHRYVILTIFLLRSVKSTGFMIVMLKWARDLETKYKNVEKFQSELRFTKNVLVITVVNLICWIPIAMIRGWVVLSYFIIHDVQITPAASAIKWALWIHWVSPAITAIAMCLIDGRVHTKMLKFYKTEISDEETKKK